MATHSSILAWRILWTEEPGELQSMGTHRVGHDWSDLAAAAAYVINNNTREEQGKRGMLKQNVYVYKIDIMESTIRDRQERNEKSKQN